MVAFLFSHQNLADEEVQNTPPPKTETYRGLTNQGCQYFFSLFGLIILAAGKTTNWKRRKPCEIYIHVYHTISHVILALSVFIVTPQAQHVTSTPWSKHCSWHLSSGMPSFRGSTLDPKVGMQSFLAKRFCCWRLCLDLSFRRTMRFRPPPPPPPEY